MYIYTHVCMHIYTLRRGVVNKLYHAILMLFEKFIYY